MKQTNINFMQGVLRATAGLLMLSGTCVLSAQEAPAKPKAKAKVVAPKYEMKEISGTVYDAATKEPMAGVRVQALNNRSYTAMTDEAGNYTIKVPKFVSTLYVSVDEYNATQVAIKGEAGQNAYLYSGLVKNLYTNGTDINLKHEYTLKETSALTVEDDIEDYLNGAVRSISRGGLPAQGAAMFINGLNSLNTNAQPLIVVDGVIWDMQYDRGTLHDGFYTNVFSVIDPEDIADVRVLTNGTALYGAKGGNGVIEIDTRRGKSMATRIKVRAYGGFEQTPDQLKMMNASQYRSYVTEFLGTTENAKNLSTATNGFMNEDPSYLFYDMYHNNTDWQKDLYEDSYTQNYKVSVEGGDDVAMYNLSLGYTQSDATAKKNDFNRLNIRFNTDIEMFRDFTTAFDIAYTKNAYNLRDNGWAEDYSSRNISSPNVLGLIQNPFVSPYEYFVKFDNDLNKLVLGHASNVYAGKNYGDANNPLAFASGYGFEGLANPYWILLNGDGDNKNYHEQTQFSINVAPKYRINKYWTVSDRFSYILNRSNEKYYLPNTGTPTKEVEGLGGVTSVIRTQFGKETTLFNDFRLQWKRQYGAHAFDFLGGFRMSSYSYSDSYITGYNNDNDKMPNMAYNLQYKDYGGTNDSWVNLAYYADLNYNLKNKYFLRLGTTMESSSRFGRETVEGVKLAGVNWGLFPSVQAAWVVSSEPWFKLPAVNYFKLNVGYEESGNDNVDYYASRTYFQNIKFLDKATSLVLANIQNPTIQWETNRRFNVGAQVNLLNNRLSLGAELYHSTTSNLLTRKAVSDITGMSMMWGNDGELSNKGVNLNASVVLVKTKNFGWQAGLSFGKYENKIEELPASNKIELYALDANGNKTGEPTVINGYTSSVYGNNNVLTAVGHAAGVFYGYQTKGVFATDAEAQAAGLKYPTGLSQSPSRDFRAGDVHFVDQNGDGWISEADQVVIGDPNPDFFGNFYTNFSYKRFSLDLNFKYSVGNDVFNYQRSQLESGNNIWNQTTAVCNRWRYQGQVTDVPRAMSADNELWVNNERFSDRWIEDGSYLKLKKVRLTYKLPVNNLSWLQGLTVWGEANNVFTLSEYTGNDPEVTAGNSVLYQGIDAGYLTAGRNFNLGITVNL